MTTPKAVKKQRSVISDQKTAKKLGILTVQILEAKPNPMFTEEQRAAVRFLCFNRTVPCAECGKRRKIMWTMLCEFYACDFNTLGCITSKSGKKHAPLTAVCDDHPLRPAWSEKGREKVRL